ncbi:MAG: hypothetical protein KTR31_09445 [Myxococcales bacterium]|nr:hypothetical protein [Myxococcales bacterium]
MEGSSHRATGPSGWTTSAGHALSAALHPVGVAPLGFGAVVYAATRDLSATMAWTAIAAACAGPALATWLWGIHRGWWTDADVSQRQQRPGLFVLGCSCLASLWLVAAWSGPPVVERLASASVLAATAGTAITLAGFKVSGHVAIPVALAALAWPTSPAATALLLTVAAVLSWARLAATRHQPAEVLGGWLLAAACAAVVGPA